MKFVGVYATDGGGMDLNSRHTNPMSFSGAASWFIAATNYADQQFRNERNLIRVTVAIYDASTVNSITAEPMQEEVWNR